MYYHMAPFSPLGVRFAPTRSFSVQKPTAFFGGFFSLIMFCHLERMPSFRAKQEGISLAQGTGSLFASAMSPLFYNHVGRYLRQLPNNALLTTTFIVRFWQPAGIQRPASRAADPCFLFVEWRLLAITQ